MENVRIEQMDFPERISKQLDNLHEFLQYAIKAENEKAKQWAIGEITMIHQLFLRPIIVVNDFDKNGSE